MHTTGTVHLGCIDCHGGKADVQPPAGAQKGSAAYEQAKKQAHPQPRIPRAVDAAPPIRCAPTREWLKEEQRIHPVRQSWRSARGRRNLRSAGCHAKEVRAVQTSMMTHGAMLWEAALYNNGAFPYKNARFGESYSPDGTAAALQTYPPPIARN